jgi:hypothetical protein
VQLIALELLQLRKERGVVSQLVQALSVDNNRHAWLPALDD